MSADDYTPSMDDIKVWLRHHAPVLWPLDALDRAIAAHDAQLRAEIAAAIRAEAEGTPDGTEYPAYLNGLLRAATIAEGRTP